MGIQSHLLKLCVHHFTSFTKLCFIDLIAQRLQTDSYTNPELSSLAAKVPKVVLQSKAENTRKKYERVFQVWERWANKYSLSPLPASETDISVYLVSIIQKCNSYASADEVFYAIKWAHELAGFDKNPCDSFFVTSVREVAHRILGHSVTKKEPITPEMLKLLVSRYGRELSNLSNLRSLSMFLLAFA